MKPLIADRSPRVTIVMPVFNGRPFFRSALESAASQTYRNLEILVVDDGSADPDEVVHDIAAVGSERVRLLRQDNGGVGSALNRAIGVASGDFFAWLSHDDLYHPAKIERQVAYHDRIGDPDGSLFSNFDLIDPAGNRAGRTAFTRASLVDAPRSALFGSLINGCTVFVPMHVMREIGPFDDRLRYTQDYDLWYRILQRHDFYLQEDCLVQYRIHGGQGTHNPAATLEGEAFWIRLLDGLTSLEWAQLGGSRLAFWRRMAARMAETPYARAAIHAGARADRAIAQTAVTVLLWTERADETLLPVLAEIAPQVHAPVEILVACRCNPHVFDEIAAPFGIPVRIVSDPDPDRAIMSAVEIALGEYIAFVDPFSRSSPHRIRDQVGRMQEHGVPMSYAPRPWNGTLEPSQGWPMEVGVVPMATAMVHRSIFAAGYRLPAFVPGWSWDGSSLALQLAALPLAQALVAPGLGPGRDP